MGIHVSIHRVGSVNRLDIHWQPCCNDASGAGTNLKVEGGGRTPEKLLSCPSTISSLQVQLVVFVSAFVMVSAVWSVSCLLFFYSRCPRAQPLVKNGGRAPYVPRALWSRRHRTTLSVRRNWTWKRYVVGDLGVLRWLRTDRFDDVHARKWQTDVAATAGLVSRFNCLLSVAGSADFQWCCCRFLLSDGCVHCLLTGRFGGVHFRLAGGHILLASVGALNLGGLLFKTFVDSFLTGCLYLLPI